MFEWVEWLERVFKVTTVTELVWVGVGLLGQVMFSMRFILQWIVSEKERKSVIPTSFWYFSIGGGLILLAYAIYRRDPVFMLGQAMGLIVYARNLYLLHMERKRSAV
ncbi:lipid-A-disaccharide synthase N-terminal domain-containing protein [Brevirhabdus sp.]|uniref:lipid-A-disaccharide synthase N-terminal domain-containing protein n=1 Tax=Brevirhabdus sp. TaxID=2004514 RepID=UPI004058B14A